MKVWIALSARFRLWLSGGTNCILQFFLISFLNASDASLSNTCVFGRTDFDAVILADRTSRSGGAELAVELARRLEQKNERTKGRARVLSISNAKYSSDNDLIRLAQLGVGVVVLPTQNEFRGVEQNDAARMRASGVRMAIGSGYDPLESSFHNIWYSAYLALTQCGFSLPEVYGGVTREAAFALGCENEFGRIAEGLPANLIAFSGDEPEDLMASPFGEHLVFTLKSQPSA